MNTKKREPVVVIDPINKTELRVKSVYRPAQTLLQGRPYHREATYLKGQNDLKFKRGGWAG